MHKNGTRFRKYKVKRFFALENRIVQTLVQSISRKKEEAPEGAPEIIQLLLAEVALEQTLKSLAVARLVAGHLVHGVCFS